MANPGGALFTTAKAAPKRARPTMGGAWVLAGILGAVAAGLLFLAAKSYERLGQLGSPAVAGPLVAGLGLLALTSFYLGWAKKIVAEADAEDARRAQFPDQPWKWKKEWQGPALAAKSGTTAAGLWVFAIIWNLISAPGVWVYFHEAHKKPVMLVVFLFPLVGLGLLWAAIYQTVRLRKYGPTRFVPTSLPGVIGGYLGGVIEVPARVTPEGEGRLVLQCIRREVRGSGKNRSTRENVLWEHEEAIARDKWVSGAGGTTIPVLFYIPPGQHDSDDRDSNNVVLWRLAASAATPGVDFATQFEVPVFATGETVPAPAAGAPVLEEYSPVPLDAGSLQGCGVRREGDTFHFSASHLSGMRFTTAVLQLGFFVLLAWYGGRGIPGPVWAITIFMGLILSLFTGSVWFDRYELRIEAADVVVTKPRPWGTKVVRVPRAEVKLIKTDKSMASGEKQYYRLSLVGAEGLNPEAAAREGEPFRARKLRYQLQRPGQGGAGSREEILAELRRQPKFVVPFAQHIPGQSRAEAIGAMVLGAIKEGVRPEV